MERKVFSHSTYIDPKRKFNHVTFTHQERCWEEVEQLPRHSHVNLRYTHCCQFSFSLRQLNLSIVFAPGDPIKLKVCDLKQNATLSITQRAPCVINRLINKIILLNSFFAQRILYGSRCFEYSGQTMLPFFTSMLCW